MGVLEFGPFHGLNDHQQPNLVGGDTAVIDINGAVDSGAIVPVLAPGIDDNAPPLGVNTARFIWRISTDRVAPISPPAGTTTVGAGPSAGTYYYAYTWVDANGIESPLSPFGDAIVLNGNQVVHLTDITIGGDPIYVTASRNVYRRTTAIGDTWRLVTSLADNTTTVYVDSAVSVSTHVAFNDGWLIKGDHAYGTEADRIVYFGYSSGSVFPKKWDGTNEYALGVPTPSGPPTVIQGALTGGLNGIYQYVVTFTNRFGNESAPTTPTASQAITGTATLTNIATSSDPQVVKRTLYRTGATGQFQVVTVFLDNTTSTYSDTTADAALGTTTLTSSFNFSPPELEGVAGPHAGSLWGWLGTRLYYSIAGNYDAWPLTNEIDFASPIKRAIVLGGELVVLTVADEWIVIGDNTANFEKIQLPSKFGCISGRSVAETEFGILWLSKSGIVNYASGAPRIISQALNPSRFSALAPATTSFDGVDAAGYYRGHYYLAFNQDSYTGSPVLVADMRDYPSTIRWREESVASLAILGVFGGMGVTSFHDDVRTGTLHATLHGDGRLLTWANGLYENIRWTTGEYTGDMVEFHTNKLLKLIRLQGDLLSNTVSTKNFLGLPSGATVDGSKGLVITLTVDKALITTYTLTTWQDTLRVPPGVRGKRVQLDLVGVFRLDGVAVEYEDVRRP